MMSWLLLLNDIKEQEQGTRAIDGLRKKLMILHSEIPKCPELEVKLKIGKIFKNQNTLEESYVKIYKIDPFFYKHYGKQHIHRKLIKMRVNIFYSELMFIFFNFY